MILPICFVISLLARRIVSSILVISMASRSVEYDKIYLYITYMSETQYKHSVVENDIRRSSQANPV